MAGKSHGKYARIYAGGYDLSGSTSQVDSQSTTETADATTFTTGGAQTTAKAYLPGMRIGKLKQKTFFDDTPGAIYPLVVAVRDAATTVATFFPGGDSAQGLAGYGSATAELLDNFVLGSPVAGVTTLEADWTATGGLEDTAVLLGKTSGAGTGAQQVLSAVLDNGAATTAGAAAYFHLFAITGGSVTAWKVQHSADNTTFVDLLTSGQAGTAAGADRQATAAATTVNRYVRAVATITNGQTATLAVAFSRK